MLARRRSASGRPCPGIGASSSPSRSRSRLRRPGGGDQRRPPGAVPPSAGAGSDLVDPPVAQVLEQRLARPSTIAPDLDQRPVTRRQGEPRLEAALQKRTRRDLGEPVARRVMRPSPPTGRLPRGEQVAPPLGPVGQAERDVAQVHEQPAEAAGHLHRRVPQPGPQVHRVAERAAPRPPARPAAGPRARGRPARAPARRSPHRPRDGDPGAAGRAGPRSPAGITTLPSGHEQLVAEVGHDPPPLLGVLDRAQRREQPGVVPAERPHARAAAATSASARATAGPGATAHAPPAATTTSGGRRARRWPGVAASEPPRARHGPPPAGAARPRPAASPHGASASSRRRSRTRSRSSGIVSQPVIASRCAVAERRAAAARRPARTPSATSGPPGAAMPRRPASPRTGRSPRPRRAGRRTSASVPSRGRRARAAVVLAASQRRRAARRSGAPPPAAGDGPRTVAPGRSGRISASELPPGVASPPASTVTRSGRRSVAAATSVAELRQQRPLVAAPGGSEAPASTARHPAVREGGRDGQDLRPVEHERPDAPAGRSPRRRSGPRTRSRRGEHGELRAARSVAHATRGSSTAAPGRSSPDRGGELRTRRRRGGARRRSTTAPDPRRRARPSHPSRRQCPADPADRGRPRPWPSRGRPRRMPGVRCSPGRCYQRGDPRRRAVRRPSRRPRRAPRAGRSAPRCPTSSRSSSVADGDSPPNSSRSTGSKNSIAGAPSGRYGRLASRKWTAGPGQAAQPDLARHGLDEGLAPLVERLRGKLTQPAAADTLAPWAGVAGGRDRRGATAGGAGAGTAPARHREGARERLVGGRTAQGEHDVLHRRRRLAAPRARPSTAMRAASSSGNPPIPVPERRERHAREPQLADARHGAAGGAVDGGAARPAIALEATRRG